MNDEIQLRFLGRRDPFLETSYNVDDIAKKQVKPQNETRLVYLYSIDRRMWGVRSVWELQ